MRTNDKMKNHRKKRKSRIRYMEVVARAFIIILAIFMFLNLVVPDRDYSAGENRSLAQKPALTAAGLESGDYFSELDDWYSDQFVLRDTWMSLRFAAEKLQGKKETSDVYIGKDGYLLGKPDEADTEKNERTISAINSFAARHSDLHMTAIVVPAAACIMTDKLPSDTPVYDQIGAIQSFSEQLDTSITVPDVITSLQDKSSTSQLYYKTDHHWTSYGAYTAYLASADALGTDSTERYIDYTVSNTFRGTMASKTGCKTSYDRIDVYQPLEEDLEYVVTYPSTGEKSASIFNRDSLNGRDQYEVFFGGNYPTVEIRTNVNNGKSLLIFKDSFANSFVQFLLPFYERITLIDPRYYYDNVETAISYYNVTDVLFLYSGDTLLTDSSLADTLETETSSADASSSGSSEEVIASSSADTSSEAVQSSSESISSTS